MADRVGQRFGDYRLTRFLGEGTFGDVYLGEHIYKNSKAAVKIFKAKLTSDKLKDFINEVRTVLLHHPNIVPLLDFGVGENDIPYLVMEYAPKGTLLQRHPRGTRLPLAIIVSYVIQIAAALQYAHDQRRIHRDVKPENMLFGENNEILLSDFGIAVVAHNTHSQRTEEAIGTALYMAPEQWQGKPVPATDQYALAIIVYEWLCGECPFRGGTLQLMYQHINAAPPPLHEKGQTFSSEVEQVVMRALAKDPEQRFESVQVFADALVACLVSGSHPKPKTPMPSLPPTIPVPPSRLAPTIPVPTPQTTPKQPETIPARPKALAKKLTLQQQQREEAEARRERQDERRRGPNIFIPQNPRRAIAARLRGIAAGISGGTGVGCFAGVLLAGIWFFFTPLQRIPEQETLGHPLASSVERVIVVFFAPFPAWVAVILTGILAGLLVGAIVGCLRSIINPSCYSSGRIAGGTVGFFAAIFVLGIAGSLAGGVIGAALCVMFGSWLGMYVGAGMGESIGGLLQGSSY